MSSTRSDPVWLGIDTATDWLGLALWSPSSQRIVAKREILAERRHAALLLPALHELLREAAVGLDDITAIGVGIGPGSYTGLRVGLASARGLASGLGCTLSGVDSLQAAAWGRLSEPATAWLSMDARRGNVYAGLYERQAGSVSTLSEPHKIPMAELAERAAAQGHSLVEAGAPDATWIARSATSGLEAAALYL